MRFKSKEEIFDMILIGAIIVLLVILAIPALGLALLSGNITIKWNVFKSIWDYGVLFFKFFFAVFRYCVAYIYILSIALGLSFITALTATSFIGLFILGNHVTLGGDAAAGFFVAYGGSGMLIAALWTLRNFVTLEQVLAFCFNTKNTPWNRLKSK